MVALCVCLVNLKKRNDEIVSKVVLMAEQQRKDPDGFNRPRTLETAGEGGPVASSKPFRGDEDEGTISQSGMLGSVEGLSVSSPPKGQPKMLFASKAAISAP